MKTNVDYKKIDLDKNPYENYTKDEMLWALDKYFNELHAQDLEGYGYINPETIYHMFIVRSWNNPFNEMSSLTYVVAMYYNNFLEKDWINELIDKELYGTTHDILDHFKDNTIDIYNIHEFYKDIFTNDEAFYLDEKDVKNDYPNMDEAEILKDYFLMDWHDVIVIPETDSLVMFG